MVAVEFESLDPAFRIANSDNPFGRSTIACLIFRPPLRPNQQAREEELGDKLGQILKDIRIPDDILAQLLESLLHDKSRGEAHGKSESEKLRTRLAQVRRGTEQAYLDKLDGKITEVFWAAKSSEWNREEQQILMALAGLEQQSPEKLLDGPGF